ncbi:type II toxin-antitoxin system HipA family toxin [Bacteroides sp. 51]|uniref:type II toxin-antitoxin system HipA family toxin n=1 Tax=Bacteroides sp. 51 TaxID=2302938 RepID=UPI0013D6AB67|nr:type II toxin-antitoxin system HipA family toxin [Bacteroides sp. 51]NDV83394.1 type II toxin-antitoxin system HipA family toxin [Bacteroides sp. 51]
MEDLIVDVSLWGKNVGVLLWDQNRDIASFEFENKFIRSGLDLSPIVMPLKTAAGMVYQFPENKSNCFKGLPGLIADSLPDAFGNQIINEWFASRGLPDDQVTPLDRLCYVGRRAMGALEFRPAKSIPGLNDSTQLHISELTELASEVFRNREEFQSKLLNQDKKILDILKVGTSAGGAKPKAIIAYNELTNEVRSGQVAAPDGFTYWLLKFDGGVYEEHAHITNNPQGIGNIEYAYYLMAKDAGIDMTECRLLPEGDNCHFMTKRFDRMNNGEKLHMQTLAGIAHFDRDQRHSYEQAFRVMRQLQLPYPQHEDFFRRMVFNVVTRNHDDHTKNHSFLMDQSGRWSLAPAYDLCYSYNPAGTWTKRHQMSINSKQDRFTFEDLQKVAEKMGIKKGKEIIEKVVDSASKWDGFAKGAGVKAIHASQIRENLLLLEPKKYNSREREL